MHPIMRLFSFLSPFLSVLFIRRLLQCDESFLLGYVSWRRERKKRKLYRESWKIIPAKLMQSSHVRCGFLAWISRLIFSQPRRCCCCCCCCWFQLSCFSHELIIACISKRMADGSVWWRWILQWLWRKVGKFLQIFVVNINETSTCYIFD